MLIQEEVWKDVKGLEGYYKISNKGRVKSVPRTIIKKNGYQARISEKILKPTVEKVWGQLRSTFSKDGKIISKSYKDLLKQHFGVNYEIVDISLTHQLQEGEVFKDVRGYEGLYEVSNYGTVRSKERVVSRRDGVVRHVSGKILADRSTEKVCLSKPINGIKSAQIFSVASLVVEAFYKNYNPGIHYIKKVKNEGSVLDQYQYLTRLEFNPVTLRLKTGEYFRFDNYIKLAEHLTTSGLKVSADIPSFKEFFFKEVHAVRDRQFDGMTIAFASPVYHRGELKLVKVFTTAVPKIKPKEPKRKYLKSKK